MARLFFCGDIINQFSNEQFIGEKLISCIKACDFAVCNLEGAISSGDFKNKGMLRSVLEDVSGIGEKRRKELLKKYSSLSKIKNATVEELSDILPEEVAKSLLEFLNKE